MLANARWVALTDSGGWSQLIDLIGASSTNKLVANTLAAAKEAGCRFALIESPYFDRDFTASFAAFYSTLFRPYKKLCRRLHFFGDDLTSSLSQTDPVAVSKSLQTASQSYMGYLVLRPLVHAPVSHAFLSHEHFSPKPEATVSVRSSHDVHLLGATLSLSGFPLTQQDMRVGSCAQAAIWMAGRHFHLKHKGKWTSMPEITSSALSPTDSATSRSLPAGSDYLKADNMVRALRAMGRHPVFYAPRKSKEGEEEDWGLDPEDVIYQYVDSGIPVILGLNDGKDVGHSVVVVGAERAPRSDNAHETNQTSESDFHSNFLIMDDQKGAYLRLPIDRPEEDQSDYNLQDHLRFIIAPLPNKVFMTPSIAEELANGVLRVIGNPKRMEARRAEMPLEKRASWPPEAKFYDAVRENRLVARTYLTFGWKYKSRLLRNNATRGSKVEVFKRDFPKYVWVTEYSYPSEAGAIEPCSRIVRAHVVIDATGSKHWESRLIVDAPGIVGTWDVDPHSDDDLARLGLALISAHNEYFAKMRGKEDFSHCDG